MTTLDGSKTYLIATATAVYAVTGWLTGHVDGGQAAQMVFEALLAATIRHGVKTGA